MGTGGRPRGWGGQDCGYNEWVTRRFKEEREENERISGLWVVITTHATGKTESEKMSYADAVSYINNKISRDVNTAATSKLGPFMPTYSIKKI